MRKRSAHSNGSAHGLPLTFRVWKESGAYVAHSPELDISSCGDSRRQARERLSEAITLFLQEAARMGTLSEILEEAGFRRKGRGYASRRVLIEEKVLLPIPAAP
jgi:predicted RNase H-like HicB family nuclease